MTKRTPLGFVLPVLLLLALPAWADPPMVALGSPQPEATINTDSQAVVVLVDASAGRTVDSVDLLVDGKLHGHLKLSPPIASGSVTLTWEVRKFTNGGHRLAVRARDSAGEVGEAAANVFVDRGTQSGGAPLVVIEQPKPGEVLSGTTQVRIRAHDPDGIKYVMLLVDDLFACLTNIPPFSYAWNTARHRNGRHTLQAKAFDAGENEGLSDLVEVLVDNPGGRTELQQPETPAPSLAELPLGLPEPAPAAPAPELKPAASAAAPTPAPQPTAGPAVPAAPMVAAGNARPAPAPRTAAPPAAALPAEARSSAAASQAGHSRVLEVALAPSYQPQAAGEAVYSAPVRALTARPAATTVPPGMAAQPAAGPAVLMLAPAARSTLPAAPSQVTPAASKGHGVKAAAPIAPATAVAASPAAPAARTQASRTTQEVTTTGIQSAPRPQQGSPSPVTSRPQLPVQRSTAARPLAGPMVAMAALPAGHLAGEAAATSTPVLPAQRTQAGPAARATAGVAPVVVALAPAQLAGNRATRPVLVTRGDLTLFVNDKALACDVAPLITPEGLALAPFRHVIEGSGGLVWWNSQDQSILARAKELDIRLTVGSRQARVADRTVLMDVATFIKAGRAIVPVRFFRDALGYEVRYEEATGGIYIAVK